MPKLTAAAIARLRPGTTRREIPDSGCPGLYLIVQPSGARSWALRFRRPTGRPAKLTLGPVNASGHDAADEPTLGTPLTLAAARRLAATIKHERQLGRDVVAARHREKLERTARGANVFAQAAIDFIEQHAKRHTRRWQSQARYLGLRLTADELELMPRGLVDRWRDRPIADIDDDDIHLLIDEVREKGCPGLKRRRQHVQSESMARAMYATLSKMFAWLLEKRRIATNPVMLVASPKISKARERVLTDAEVVKLWGACDKLDTPFEQFFKLLLLTGCRRDEVAKMQRRELADAVWEIPGTRTKNHRPHVVPLAPVVRSIIKSVDSEGELVFTTNGKTPVSGFSKLKKKLDKQMKIAPWRLHDLRRTCATGMAELGIAPHIVEACLNHISGAKGGIAGVYNRALYAAEKKAALERWASHVTGLVSGRPAKVVPLRKVD